VDILYDIAYAGAGRLFPMAQKRASSSLENEQVRAKASRALSVVLSFRRARTCEAKHDLLAEAREHGDVRMLSLLEPYASTGGCGFMGRFDCNPCMRSDTSLTDAIQAIVARKSAASASRPPVERDGGS
jgi:serine/threonine-protein kinase